MASSTPTTIGADMNANGDRNRKSSDTMTDQEREALEREIIDSNKRSKTRS